MVKHGWLRSALFVLAVIGVVAFVGCRAAQPAAPSPAPAAALAPAPQPAEKVEPAPPAPVWTLQFTDNFDRAELGGDWQIVAGNWQIEDGMLATVAGESSKMLVCNKKFPGDQRLEFDARTDDPKPCDLSGILNCAADGYPSGYFFGFGSEWNAFSKLLILSNDVKHWDTVIQPGELHRVVCQREGNTLTHVVDGQVVMTFTHDAPLTGEGHDMVGFYVFSTGKIDNVKVYTKGEN